MSQPRILVLPAGMPAAIRYARVNREHQYLIGASSNLYEPSRGFYREYTFLPHISDANFLEAFKRVVEDRKIVGVVCQHQVIWSYLQQLNYSGMPPLLNPAPIPSQLSPYRSAMQDAGEFTDYIRHFDSTVRVPSHLQIAGLFKHFDDIPGECDHDKFLLFLLAAANTPAGDVVEIGSLWGKSAYVLGWLSHFYQLGSVLCIDPWSKNAAEQQSQNNQLVLLSSSTHDISEGFQVFCQNLLAAGFAHVNYLRMMSSDAAETYQKTAEITTPEFGSTTYQQRISVLHIDGNHDLAVVEQDVRDWCDRVVPGGWIILDDYTWKFGEGPKIAGDRYLEKCIGKISHAFVMGGALAIRKVA